MNDCETYRRDPSADPGHPDGCESCRADAAALDSIDRSLSDLVKSPRADFRGGLEQRLPVAPWEGARHRSWGLVLAVLAMLVILVAAALMASGVNPITAIQTLVSAALPMMSPAKLARSFSALIASAPASFHITIGILFVVVNVVLLLLLRRPPKGYDA